MPEQPRVIPPCSFKPGTEVRVQGTTRHGFVLAAGKQPGDIGWQVLVWIPHGGYDRAELVELAEYEVDEVR